MNNLFFLKNFFLRSNRCVNILTINDLVFMLIGFLEVWRTNLRLFDFVEKLIQFQRQQCQMIDAIHVLYTGQ